MAAEACGGSPGHTRSRSDAPIAHVPYEVINQWSDQVWKHSCEYPYRLDLYDAAEVEALVLYQEVLEAVARAVPDDYPGLSDVEGMPEWRLLRDTAQHTSGVLMRRGKLPEDREIA